ncbi:hypothetical protein FALBO_6993 [Fusarium albosuccineum]|uniref:Uncharacterized protein n=1 Tax=Fusarium albosuccineum TaxID=1237068 RepID=A0A8H4LAM3_9HYPO|nr:hypothetical protein FALBO_6993 [Fusarium albosuccineum]
MLEKLRKVLKHVTTNADTPEARRQKTDEVKDWLRQSATRRTRKGAQVLVSHADINALSHQTHFRLDHDDNANDPSDGHTDNHGTEGDQPHPDTTDSYARASNTIAPITRNTDTSALSTDAHGEQDCTTPLRSYPREILCLSTTAPSLDIPNPENRVRSPDFTISGRSYWVKCKASTPLQPPRTAKRSRMQSLDSHTDISSLSAGESSQSTINNHEDPTSSLIKQCDLILMEKLRDFSDMLAKLGSGIKQEVDKSQHEIDLLQCQQSDTSDAEKRVTAIQSVLEACKTAMETQLNNEAKLQECKAAIELVSPRAFAVATEEAQAAQAKIAAEIQSKEKELMSARQDMEKLSEGNEHTLASLAVEREKMTRSSISGTQCSEYSVLINRIWDVLEAGPQGMQRIVDALAEHGVDFDDLVADRAAPSSPEETG